MNAGAVRLREGSWTEISRASRTSRFPGFRVGLGRVQRMYEKGSSIFEFGRNRVVGHGQSGKEICYLDEGGMFLGVKCAKTCTLQGFFPHILLKINSISLDPDMLISE